MHIDLRDKSLPVAFFLSLFFFPFFAPFLVISFYQKPLSTSLLYALFCGIILDLLSSHLHLGLYSLNLCLTTALLYGTQRNFFSDRFSTLFLMTYLFVATSTGMEFILMHLFEKSLSLSLTWVFTDILMMPFRDAFIAFALFTLPALKARSPTLGCP